MSGISSQIEEARSTALLARMFKTDVLPWECAQHVPVEVTGLGRTWQACSSCGFILDPDDRELVLRLARSS